MRHCLGPPVYYYGSLKEHAAKGENHWFRLMPLSSVFPLCEFQFLGLESDHLSLLPGFSPSTFRASLPLFYKWQIHSFKTPLFLMPQVYYHLKSQDQDGTSRKHVYFLGLWILSALYHLSKSTHFKEVTNCRFYAKIIFDM